MSHTKNNLTALAVKRGRRPSSLDDKTFLGVQLSDAPRVAQTLTQLNDMFLASDICSFQDNSLDSHLLCEVVGVRGLYEYYDGIAFRPTYPRPGVQGGLLKIQSLPDALPRFDLHPQFYLAADGADQEKPLLFTDNPKFASIAADEFGIDSVTLLPGGSNITDIGRLKAHVVDMASQFADFMQGTDLERVYHFVFDGGMGAPVVGYEGLTWLMEATLERKLVVSSLHLPPIHEDYEEEREAVLHRLRTYLSAVRGI